ncbi:MAG: DMT family protein [Bacteroidales bacterium]|nr:DMT family protein [Bacteroidales bacterium]MBD5282743.1 DMT family protein [Bacteroides sp.]MDE6032376.1 DMT family protein [Muribaculaceae bacterium]MBD5293837.1 DMT family protein [Bacteroides sp.]MBD5342582.1 DMT family protein [Bacteroides sp.]
MKSMLITILLLVAANVFMTFAWYGHLKLQSSGVSTNWPLIAIILLSWGIAFIEYCLQIPANRIGFDGNGGPFSLIQLKVMQEVITLVIFIFFTLIFFKDTHFRWNHLVSFLMLIGAVYFAFKK